MQAFRVAPVLARALLALAALPLPAHAAAPARAADLPAAAERAAADLALALGTSPERPAIRRIAVAPLAEAPSLKGYGRVVEEILATRLAAAGIEALDRAKLAAVLGEQKVAATAGVEAMDRAKVAAVLGEQRLMAMFGSGKSGGEAELAALAGAQAVVTGELADGGDRVFLKVQLRTLPSGRAIGQSQQESDLPAKGAAAVRAPLRAEGVDVAVRRVADGLAAGFARLPGSAKYRRLAVLTFTEAGEEARRRQLGAVVTAELATDLRRDHGLLLVERAKLGEVLSELKVQQSLAPSVDQAARLGRMADAQALVIGSVAEAGDRYLVNARIVSTETGETLAAESQPVAAAGLVALASDAVVLRSRSGALFRSLLVPGWGQHYNREAVKGWAFLGAEVALLGGALAYHLSGNAAYDDYRRATRAELGPSPSARAAELYDTARSRYVTRNWLLGGAAVVWAVNVADAWLSGVDGEKLLGGAAVAAAPLPGGAAAALALRF